MVLDATKITTVQKCNEKPERGCEAQFNEIQNWRNSKSSKIKLTSITIEKINWLANSKIEKTENLHN